MAGERMMVVYEVYFQSLHQLYESPRSVLFKSKRDAEEVVKRHVRSQYHIAKLRKVEVH